MKNYRILWRFVFEADDIATAETAAQAVAQRIGLTDLPPVKAYKEANWWITDVVVPARDESLAVLFGRQLALCGRLANEWLVSAIADLDDDGGGCHAVFNAGERNPPAIAGLRWALAEAWPDDEPAAG